MKISICVNCGKQFKWSREFYENHNLKIPPLHCHECNDRRAHKDAHHTAVKRECVLRLECVDVSAVEELHFETIAEQDGHALHHPYRRVTVKGRKFGASWSGRIDVFDQRTDTSSNLASVRIMRTQHAAGKQMTGVRVTGPSYPWYSREEYQYEHNDTWTYVVLEDQIGGKPNASLVYAEAIQKWNRDDGISGAPLWQTQCQGASRSGRHSGQAVLALVDAEHPLTVDRVYKKSALHKGDRLEGRGPGSSF